eukprot:jgi/Botrbrau1/15862/Bobra.40_1s0046.1
MSWWRGRKAVGPTAEHCGALCLPAQGTGQPVSRKRYSSSDEALQGQKIPTADAMLNRLMSGHMSGLLQRISTIKRARVENGLDTLMVISRPLSKNPERGRQLAAMYDNFREARCQWFQEGVLDGCSQKIRQIILLTGEHENATPSWHWPYDARVFRVPLPRRPSRTTSEGHDGASHIWDASPRCMVHVKADVRIPQQLSRKLLASGFRPAHRSIIILEGLQYLLPAVRVKDVLSELTRLAAPGSLLLLDYLHLEVFNGDVHPQHFPLALQIAADSGRPMQSGMASSPDVIKFDFIRHGFHPLELLNPRDIGERFLPDMGWPRRRPPLPPWHSFISAQKLRHTALFSESNYRDVSPITASNPWSKVG